MDGSDRDSIEYLIAKLIKFYNGGISYSDFMSMPIPKIYQLALFSGKISGEEERYINNLKDK